MDTKFHTAIYLPVNVGDFIEWMNEADMYNRVSRLMTFGLVGMKEKDYVNYDDESNIDCIIRNAEDSYDF